MPTLHTSQPRLRGGLEPHVCGVGHVVGNAALAAGVDGGVAVGPTAAAVERLRVDAAGRVVDGVALEADC